MSDTIHARLDEQTCTVRDQLQQQYGWNDSQIVREGIKALSYLVAGGRKRKIVGLGKFESGVKDLGSNERHLEGFGQ